MSELARRLALLLLGALLAACASKQGSVVLLPERDGKNTAVVVNQGGTQVPLGQPYAAAHLTSGGPKAYQSSAQEVQTYFAAALAAQPVAPAQFTLYFVDGKDEFTEESKRVIDGIFSVSPLASNGPSTTMPASGTAR